MEICLDQCSGGKRILEIGFGSGVSFLNLAGMYKEIHGLDLTADANAVHDAFAARGINTTLLNGSVLKMDYPDNYFDTVLLISILEHLKPPDLQTAFKEIRRVLRPGGQMIYGVPVERPLMVFAFRLLGYNIHEHHFSTHRNISNAADANMQRVSVRSMYGPIPGTGAIYEVGHFVKSIG